MCRAYFFAKSVFLHDFQIYQYLQRANGSIMSSLDFKTITSRDAIIDSLHTFKSMHAFSVADKYFIDEYIAKVLMGLYSLKIKDKSDYISFLDKILKNEGDETNHLPLQKWIDRQFFRNRR